MAKKKAGKPNNAGQESRVYDHRINGKPHNCRGPIKKK